MNPHKITAEFENALCDYTGAPYAVAVDNCSNAIFLALMYDGYKGEIEIPCRTYPSVPCEIIHAGAKVKFKELSGDTIRGYYHLHPTKVIDSALHFTANMYITGTLMCLSFTGPYKHLKLGKGGAILTDSKKAYQWLKKARFSGRNECSYLEDEFTMLGWNFYMSPEVSARGLHLIQQFYTDKGKVKNEPLTRRYPDLSKFKIYG